MMMMFQIIESVVVVQRCLSNSHWQLTSQMTCMSHIHIKILKHDLPKINTLLSNFITVATL